MSYGDPKWQGWVLEEEEAIKHIKAAYDAGINAFDTANIYSHGVRIQNYIYDVSSSQMLMTIIDLGI